MKADAGRQLGGSYSDPTRAGAGMGWEQWREMKQFQLYFGKNGDKA